MRSLCFLLIALCAAPLDAQEKLTIPWDADWVTAVTFAGPSRRLIAGNKLGQIVAWDIPDKLGPVPPPVRRFDGHTNMITALAATPDGRWLVSTSYDHTVRLWDLGAPPKSKGTILLRPGNKKKEKGDEAVVEVQEADKVLTAHGEWVRGLSLSADGKHLLTGDDKGLAIVWELPIAREVKRLQTEGWLQAVALSPDARQAVTCTSSPRAAALPSSILLWDIASEKMTLNLGETLKREKGPGNALPMVCAAFSRDGKHLAFAQGGEADGGNGKLFILDAKTGKKLREITAHYGGSVCVAFHPDSQHLASGGRDTLARLWKISDGKQVAEYGKTRGGQFRDWIHHVAFSADGQLIAAADMAGFVHIYMTKN